MQRIKKQRLVGHFRFIPIFHQFRKTSNQSVNDSTGTDITFNVEDHDPGSIHAAGSAEFILNKIGLWLVHAVITIAANNAGNRTIYINHLTTGGVAIEPTQTGKIFVNSNQGYDTTLSVVRQIFNDTVTNKVTVAVWQNSGGALNVLGYPNAWSPTSITLTYLGGAKH